MTPSDIPALLELEEVCNPSPWRAPQWAEALCSAPAGQRYMGWVVEADADTDTACTPCEGRAILGYVLTMRVLDEASLLLLGVAPRARRQGWGQNLLQHAAARLRAQGANCLHLEVRCSNRAARDLYRAAGCIEVGHRFGYYPAPDLPTGREDAVSMRWDF